MIACSIGTICAFLFIEVIPDTIHHIVENFGKDCINAKACIPFGLTIFFGMILAASLELLEHDDIDHHNDKDQDTASGETTSSEKATSCFAIPNTVKTIMLATVIHNLVDGMVLAMTPVMAIGLFFHEITHVVGQLAIYVNLGVGKRKALLIRLLTDLFTPIAAISTYYVLSEETPLHHKIKIYGHCLLIGLFMYVLLVDLVPILFEKDSKHNHQSTNDIEENNDNIIIEKDKCKTFYVFMCFIISFGIVATIILLK